MDINYRGSLYLTRCCHSSFYPKRYLYGLQLIILHLAIPCRDGVGYISFTQVDLWR